MTTTALVRKWEGKNTGVGLASLRAVCILLSTGAHPPPYPLPLYPHQEEGARWLAERSAALLADDPGLGKTITALAAAASLQPAEGRARPRILVLCPTVVLYNWQAETEKWLAAPRVQVVTHGRAQIEKDADVVIVTHGLLLAPWISSQLLSAQWDVAIVDEAHAFKSITAKRTAALYHAQAGIVKAAQRVWLLTGTPCPNHAGELYTHLRGLDWKRLVPEQLEEPLTYDEFVYRYCRWRETPYGVQIVGNQRERLPELKKALDGFVLRRRKEDVLKDLPPIRMELVHLRPLALDAALASLEAELSSLVKDRVAGRDVEDTLGFFDAVKDDVGFTRFRRLCGLAKAGSVVDLLAAELEDGALDKVVVFAHHRDVVDQIAEGLERFGVRTITGETPAAERTARVKAFQESGNVRVMVSNIVAGGVGVTLTAASEVVFAEQSWTPGENAQAADRCHRIGQTERVRVRFVALAGTLDTFIAQALRRKIKMIQEVIGA